VDASPLTLSFAIVAAGFIGGIVPFFFEWNHRTAHRWIAFGAGVILGVAFLHMIPEAYELAGAGTLGVLLIGFLALYAIEQFTFKHPHEEDEGELYELGFLAFLGLIIHDLIDGIALGSGEHLPRLTPAIFIALIAHKIPTTFALSLLMLHGGYTRAKILRFLAILLAAIPLGVLLSTRLLDLFPGDRNFAVGTLINFSAGTFIYIGAYELLPEMHRKSPPGSRIGIFFILGAALMAILKYVHPVF
jgi:zinc and cadmium transporter